jgi:hypothetical protein
VPVTKHPNDASVKSFFLIKRWSKLIVDMPSSKCDFEYIIQ